MEHKVVTDYTNVNTQNEYLKVYVRARPPENADHAAEDMFTVGPGPGASGGANKKVVLKDPRQTNYGEHAFMFDRVFWTEDGQEDVFTEVANRSIKHCFKGYNACCFAYGQTGSGKTYSMFGESSNRGLIPRAVERVFDIAEEKARTHEVAVLVSFLEMYCDNIRDLGQAYLDKSGRPDNAQKTSDLYLEAHSDVGRAKRRAGHVTYRSQNLEIREDAFGNVFVKDLSVIPVTTPEEVITIVQMGFRLRATHETKMNAVSSRSHTVFTMTVVQKDRATGETVTGMLNLVDLAGSERLTKSESEGQRLREALSINSSLSALGKVVMALDPSVPSQYVPYRDSKLTRLLQNSIGGNSYTTLLACMHPRNSDYDECLSTLQFANRCRNVRNQPRVNYVDQSGEDKDRRIRKLQTEVDSLRTTVDGMHRGMGHRLRAVLTMLGIKGTMLPDGRFQTADGRVVGLGDIAADAMGGGPGAGLAGVFGASGVMGGSPAVHTLPDSRIKKMLDMERRNVTILKAKLSAKKEEVARLKSQAKKDTADLRGFMNTQRRAAEDNQHGLMEKQRRLQAMLVKKDDVSHEVMQELIEHNRELLEHQQQVMALIPKQLKVDSTMLQRAHSVEERVRKEEAERRSRDVRAAEASAAVELESVRQQLGKRVEEQDKLIKEMTREAAAYHSKRRQQITEYRREIEALANYVRHVNTTLSKIERGVFPVRQLASGRKTFALPNHCKPRDPLRGMDLSKFTKTLHSTIATHEGEGGDGSQLSQPRSALDAIRKARGANAGAASGAGAGAGAGAGSQGDGASDARPSSAWGQRPSSRGPRPTSPLQIPPPRVGSNGSMGGGGGRGVSASRARLMEDSVRRMVLEGVDFDSDVDAMSHADLKAKVLEFRQLIQSGLYDRIEEQVLNDLSEHETAAYIQELEATVKKLQASLRDEAVKHRELRIAFTAQQRSCEKLKAKLLNASGPGRQRPASATVHRSRLDSARRHGGASAGSHGAAPPGTAPLPSGGRRVYHGHAQGARPSSRTSGPRVSSAGRERSGSGHGYGQAAAYRDR